MSCNEEIGRWDWKKTKRGDTKPAVVVSIPGRDAALARARCKVVDDSGTVALNLDSDTSGITLNTTAAPTWEFTIDAIAAATTEALTAGTFSQDIETTDASGVVKTWLEGTWVVTPQSTDA
jgi:hypothetical protein